MTTEIRSVESGCLIAEVAPPPLIGSYIKLTLNGAYMGNPTDEAVYLDPVEALRLARALAMAARP